MERILAQRWGTLRVLGLLHGLWVAAFVALAAPTLAFLWERWTRSIWNNGHGIFVPLLVGLLAHHALRHEPTKREEPSAWGFAFLVPALALVAADSAIQTELMAAAGILLALPGLALLLLGVRRTRALAFPCFLAFFMLPIPGAFMQTIHEVLRRITTAGSSEVLRFLRLPALAEGTLLHLPHGTFHVVEECSGFSALYAAVTIAFVLAYLSRSRARRIVLVLVPWPLALAGNVLRIVALAILAESRGFQVLSTPLHLLSGYLSFVLTLLLVFAFAEPGPRRAAA